jgi:hypothetical protein
MAVSANNTSPGQFAAWALIGAVAITLLYFLLISPLQTLADPKSKDKAIAGIKILFLFVIGGFGFFLWVRSGQNNGRSIRL